MHFKDLWYSMHSMYFGEGDREYFVLAAIKAAIILVINFNAAHARKRANERFDKRAVSPRLSFRLVSPLSTIHLLHSTYRISF